MKKTIMLFCGLMAIALAACTHNELPQVGQLEKPAGGRVVSVKAYTPDGQADSRLAFDEQSGSLAMTWTVGDAFKVMINEAEVRFSYDAAKEAFTATLPEGAELEDEMPAYYPAGRDGLDVQSGKLDGRATFMQGTYSAATNSFTFRHTTAILKATFSGVPNNAEISSVRVGIGQNAINIPYTDELDLTDGVYIYLPANNNTAVAQGQKMVFAAETEDGEIYTATQTVQKAEGIEAGKFYTAGIALTKIPYVTFTAQSAGQKLNYTGTNLQYSTDAVVWTFFNGTDDVEFGGETKLYLRGIENSAGTITPVDNYTISFINNDNKVACTGDIRTLLDYETYDTVGTGGAMFPYLFKDCIALTSAPALPATVLYQSCYKYMFAGCTSLTSAPELPAMNLAFDCYESMFAGCTSLTSAPELPAMNLAFDCYESMFAGCTSLTAAPELPAETLTNLCYKYMFAGCTSLTSAPKLPAVTLKYSCYQNMFAGCTSLSSVTMLATDVNAASCLDSWLDGVAATGGTLYVDANKVAEFTSNKSAYGIPESWTVTAYTPQP